MHLWIPDFETDSQIFKNNSIHFNVGYAEVDSGEPLVEIPKIKFKADLSFQ